MDNRSAATAADRFFRHEAGRMLARLTRLLGPRYFDLAEDAVQDAMCAALETWKFHGIPRAPEAWLMRAAHNRAIDLIRANRRLQNLLTKIALDPGRTSGGAAKGGFAEHRASRRLPDVDVFMLQSRVGHERSARAHSQSTLWV